MAIDQRIEKLIVLLTRESSEGRLLWGSSEVPSLLTQGTEDIYPIFLVAEYNDKKLGLFLRKYQYYYDEHDYSWSQEIGLCVLDNKGSMLWEYNERSAALANLFEVARQQASGINDIMKDLLG